jgi:hypothetical protein
MVGLIPQSALVDTAVWYTQLDQFEPEQILENRLYTTQMDFNIIRAGSRSPFSFLAIWQNGNTPPLVEVFSGSLHCR